jgi:hypothetical protein
MEGWKGCSRTAVPKYEMAAIAGNPIPSISPITSPEEVPLSEGMGTHVEAEEFVNPSLQTH